MYGDLELLDVLYERLWQSRELAMLLGSPTTPEARNEKIRRELTPAKLASVEKLNFMSMYFSSATETNNIYVARGFLNVDYFARSREDMRQIQTIVKQIFEANYLLRVSFYNWASVTKGVFCYAEKYRPLVFA